MSALFEELDYRVTELGTLVLRRRRDLSTGEDIHEIKLDDAFLMSSKFTASEEALARLGLEAVSGDELRIVVGGLGLGYTAATALESPRVAALIVVEALRPVIEWHESGLLPLGKRLGTDGRCRLVHGDFFEMAAHPETGFDPERPAARHHAILLDIDHSPGAVLKPSNAELYTEPGLARLSKHLLPGGVFALWSNEPEDPAFTARLKAIFAEAHAEPVVFHNPLQDRQARQSVYIARRVA